MSAEREPTFRRGDRVRGIAGVCTMLTKARWLRGRARRVFAYVEDGGRSWCGSSPQTQDSQASSGVTLRECGEFSTADGGTGRPERLRRAKTKEKNL